MQLLEDAPGPDNGPAQATQSPNPAARANSDPGVGRKGLSIRALVADDDLVAREVLCRLLRSEPDVEVVATAVSGKQAVEAINRSEPDLVFLDIQMPELDGFGVVRQIRCRRSPVIIFVTANHEFALKAFDVHALDYMVKPCSRERLKIAVQRAREQIQRELTQEFQSKLSAWLDRAQPGQKAPERIAVKSKGRIVFLKLTEIDWLEAADNYVELHVGDQTHLLRETMKDMEASLPPDRFLRISRSAMVNIEQIKELEPLFHGEYSVVLRSGTRLTLTRGHRQKLHQVGLLGPGPGFLAPAAP